MKSNTKVNQIAEKFESARGSLFSDSTPAYPGIAEDMRTIEKAVKDVRFIQSRLDSKRIGYNTALEALSEISLKSAASIARINFWTRKEKSGNRESAFVRRWKLHGK